MLTIRQITQANAQRHARLQVEDRAKFLYNEYIGFESLKEFADFFSLTLDGAIAEITLGRRLEEKGL